MNPELIKRLKNMQKEMETKQAELEQKEFTVEKQGIKVVVKGDMSVSSIEVSEVLVDPDDVELLQDLITVAINEALDLVKQEQANLAPQMPGMPF
ncbi:YbaB/EbfC family nucleoid-associated protein [Mycoplasma nasistruthionis]|uniref:Nucleoid-associated protein FG904_02780 n=1 Tax=Mycoplasma nasistruthionis TaxID=353852 RepID=A0A4Y6I794_9MOLU|nr:YbaB/EbfC family nucleoid-associated protein [Mycoplasma nasistruthionis]QCZ36914.1 YbaB/EbfC family nucleoid-associated protein [Mycoplasma nasistruthionis]QDF65190.1 YbaB/EbfC family nucleoid-associated protein [Mycoplasma nasistruthionis]